MPTVLVDAKELKKEMPPEQQVINDVYIGVFFDGTNNNMVQKARFTGTGKNIVTKSAQGIWYSAKKTVWYAIDKTPFWDEEDYNATHSNEKFTERSPESRGYSNIAFLHDNCCIEENEWKKNADNCLCKIFYIEGSGATDTSQFISGNPNGLGFGLGNTGVTALVSKAVKYISDYVNSNNLNKSEVKLHFYVFGFSRGATCARLFSRLITRGKCGGEIAREKEFSEHYAKHFFDGCRLNFLNEYTHKVVECLGIYDTVVSIGFLMQRDGQVHPYMRSLYDWGENYDNNWHYLNVFEYGLSLNDTYAQKIKKICHICAMDEFRENFALTDVGESVPCNAVEILVPGCHSDVGGGYVDCEEEQEIVLTKVRKHNYPVPNTGCVTNSEDVKTFVSLGYPLDSNIDRHMDMSVKAISELGWIEENAQNVFKDENNSPLKKGVILKNEIPYTLRSTEKKDCIKFKRNVRGGYSNITLKMMMKFANKEAEAPAEIFTNKEPDYFAIPKDLKVMGDVMVNKAENASFSERIWIRPSETDYRKLRMKYIHFTCTSDENYHLNNPFNFKGVHTVEGTLGNLGNTPNFDLGGRLCRIVYHSDSTKPNSVVDAMHYLYEYGTSGSVAVNCDIDI